MAEKVLAREIEVRQREVEVGKRESGVLVLERKWQEWHVKLDEDQKRVAEGGEPHLKWIRICITFLWMGAPFKTQSPRQYPLHRRR